MTGGRATSWGAKRSLPPEKLTVARVLSHEAYNRGLARLQMYEMRLERSLHACLRQLAKLKKEQNEQNEANEEPEQQEREAQEASEQNEATEGSEAAKSSENLTRDTAVSSV